MALPNASVIRKSNPEATPIEGNDNYSGLVFFGNVASTSLTTLSNKRLLKSPLDAESVGIDYSYSDETKANSILSEYELLKSDLDDKMAVWESLVG